MTADREVAAIPGLGQLTLADANSANKVSKYFGETGSSGYFRMQKHIQEIKSRDLSNGFAKHLEVHHKDHVRDPTVFDLKIEKTFKKNLDQ